MTNNKKYELLKENAPQTPKFTCPTIDQVIENMEVLRTSNDELRDVGEYWKERCYDLCAEIEYLQIYEHENENYDYDYDENEYDEKDFDKMKKELDYLRKWRKNILKFIENGEI